MLNIVDIFQSKTGASDTDTEMYIEVATAKVLARTGRTETIDPILPFILDLALCQFYKNGNEGLNSYSEGGVNESYKTEEEILSGLNRYRLLTAAVRAQETDDEEA